MRQFWQDALTSSFPLVFGAALLVVLFVRYPYDSFFAVDPYYHLSQARGYATDTVVTYPELTYFSAYPSDPWFGYHYLIAAGFIGADVSNPAALIKRSVLVHSVLSALLVATLIMMGLSYYKTVLPVYLHRLRVFNVPLTAPRPSDRALTGILLGVYLFVSMSFVYRVLLLERPHVLMLLLVLVGLWSVIRQQYRVLVVLGAIAALSYSMALFIFIPAAVLVVGWVIVDRSRVGWRSTLVPVWYTLGGFGVGVLLHPGTVGYLVNGLLFHAFAIIQSLFWWLPQVYALPMPGEMGFQTESMIAVLVPVTIVMGGFWFTVRYGKNRVTAAHTRSHAVRLEAGFTAMAVFFSIVTLLIQRAIEYAVPFLGAACVTIVIGLVWSLVFYLHHHLKLVFPDPRSFYQSGVAIMERHVALRWPQRLCTVLVVVYVVAFSMFVLQLEPAVTSTDRLADTVEALASEPAVGLVILGTFSMYPQAVLYGPTYHYASGMDPRMTFFFDPETSAELDSFLGQDKRCYTICHNPYEATSLAFLQRWGATHVMIDTHYLLEHQVNYITEQPFLELVYQSTAYPDVRLYRIIKK